MGELGAPSRLDALRELDRQGLTPLVLEPVQRRFGSRRRLKSEELNMAIHELATLLSAGVSLVEAVEALERTTHHASLASAFERIGNGLRQGKSFPRMLEGVGLPLPDYAYQLVAAGELSGNLAGALHDCARQLEYERHTREEIRSALIYPSILVLSGLLAVATLFVFVVPKFSHLLNEVSELPWLAWVVLSFGAWSAGRAGWLLAVLVLGAVIAGAYLAKKEVRQRVMDQAARLPVVGPWMIQAEVAQWAKVLGTLLGNRIPLVDALHLSASGIRLGRLRVALERVTRDVRAGSSLSSALEARQATTAIGANLIRVGERSGQLAEMLVSLAELHEGAGRVRMRRVLALVEPLAILLIGAAFGLIITGVVLAITSANDLAF